MTKIDGYTNLLQLLASMNCPKKTLAVITTTTTRKRSSSTTTIATTTTKI